MARYVQQISLVPFSTAEIWVGWELEGVNGDVDGLLLASTMSESELARLGVSEFQRIPAAYAGDLVIRDQPANGRDETYRSTSGARS